jgi:hypothetical protein
VDHEAADLIPGPCERGVGDDHKGREADKGRESSRNADLRQGITRPG